MNYVVEMQEDWLYVKGGDEGLEASFAVFEGVIARREPFCVLSDMRGVRRPSSDDRAATQQWIEENQPLLDLLCPAWAIVVDNPLQHAVVAIMTWFSPHEYPLQVFRDMEKAKTFLREAKQQRVN